MTDHTSPPPATLLLVDDSPDNLQLLYGLLKTDYHIRVANGGVRALKLLENSPLPDLVLLDVMMPDMDGYSVCQAIRANPRTAGVPVTFISASSGPEEVARGLAAGGCGFISKPIEPTVLFDHIAQILNSRPAGLIEGAV